MTLVSTPAVILRTHPYGDTSLVVKALTSDLGLQTMMARGVRSRGGKGGAAPQVFSSGSLTIYHRAGREMHPLRSFEPDRIRRGLTASMVRFAGAALLTELVLRHFGAEGGNGLLEQLNSALDGVERSDDRDTPGLVLAEAWRLVGALGYRPELSGCVRCVNPFSDDEMGRFDFGLGGVLCATCGAGGSGPRVGPGARRELLALIGGPEGTEAFRPDSGLESHVRPHLQLLSDFVTYHVSGSKPLSAFGYFASFLPDSHE